MKYDSRELRELGADLAGIGRRTAGPVIAAFGESAGDLASTWARNAKETAGVHGKHYPRSIDFEMRASTNVHFEVGPNKSKKQGGMGAGFEYGSKNQPPHLDGQRAADEVLPRLEERVSRALVGLFEKSDDKSLREYTTKAGVTRMATRAQIDNWTRGR
jgi:hypothetical protein